MAKRVIKQVDFSQDGSHICICGNPANGQEEVTILKSKEKKIEKQVSNEVQISTSMQTFLRTFFGMWIDDASELAEVLGYEPQEWTYSAIGDDTQVQILKSLTTESMVDENLYKKIVKMEKDFKLLQKEKNMEKKGTKVEVDLQKSIDDAVKVALEKAAVEAKVEATELVKAKDVEIAELRKAEDTRIKGEYVELCKGYSFVEDADVLATTLFKCKSVEGFDVILTTLEKARVAVKTALEGEIGTDEERDLNKSGDLPTNLTKTAELIKARYNTKESK